MFNKVLVPVDVTMKKDTERCCQTNENSHQIAGAALTYALNSWRHSARAAVRLSLKLSRE